MKYRRSDFLRDLQETAICRGALAWPMLQELMSHPYANMRSWRPNRMGEASEAPTGWRKKS